MAFNANVALTWTGGPEVTGWRWRGWLVAAGWQCDVVIGLMWQREWRFYFLFFFKLVSWVHAASGHRGWLAASEKEGEVVKDASHERARAASFGLEFYTVGIVLPRWFLMVYDRGLQWDCRRVMDFGKLEFYVEIGDGQWLFFWEDSIVWVFFLVLVVGLVGNGCFEYDLDAGLMIWDGWFGLRKMTIFDWVEVVRRWLFARGFRFWWEEDQFCSDTMLEI